MKNKKKMTQSEEIWKDIPDYEGSYLISNLGRVNSLLTNKILKPSIDTGGYKVVCLCKNNKKKNFNIHQLVAMAFLNHTPNRFELVVNHKDSNKLNNKLDNLEIITNRQNLSIERVKVKSEKAGIALRVGVDKRSDKFRIQFHVDGKKLKYFGNYKDVNQANNLATKILNLIEKNYSYKEIVNNLKNELSLKPNKLNKILNK